MKKQETCELIFSNLLFVFFKKVSVNSIPSYKIPRSFITHADAFHADEVTACALLLCFNEIDIDKIYRRRLNKPEDYHPYVYVCDMGGYYDEEKKLFDHHQREYKGDKSSAGLILFYLEKQGIITTPLRDYLNNSVIIGVDAIDNGLSTPVYGHASFSSVVESYMPLDQNITAEEMDKKFMEAVSFVKGYLLRLIERHNYLEQVREKIEVVMREGTKKHPRYLLFDEPLPWVELFFSIEKESYSGNHPAQFIIMQAGENYKLRCIPPSIEQRMDKRFPHPDSWCGLSGDKLENVCSIEGAIFCHKNSFISIWKTLESAIKAVEKILKGKYD